MTLLVDNTPERTPTRRLTVQDHINRTKFVSSVLRANLACHALALWFYALFTPGGVLQELIRVARDGAPLAIHVLGAIGLVSIVDCTVNDWCGRCNWSWAHRWRFMLQIALAMAYGAILFLIHEHLPEQFFGSIPIYMSELVFAAITGMAGAKWRYRQAISASVHA